MAKLVFQFFPYLLAVLVAVQPTEDILAKFHQKDYKIRYDRSLLIWYDPYFYKHFAVKTFKYNRTQAVINMTYELKTDFGYDLQSLFQVYKLYNNEYKVFAIRMQNYFCSLIDYNIGGLGKAYLEENPPCPLRNGVNYSLTNFFPDESLLPPLMPNGEFMIDMTMLYKNKNISTLLHYGMIYRPFISKD